MDQLAKLKEQGLKAGDVLKRENNFDGRVSGYGLIIVTAVGETLILGKYLNLYKIRRDGTGWDLSDGIGKNEMVFSFDDKYATHSIQERL